MKDINEPHAFGSGHVQNPWFWSVGRPSGMSEAKDADWGIEGVFCYYFCPHRSRINFLLVEQLQWFCDCADHDRWLEEKETLEMEFEQTEVTHSKMANCWLELSKSMVVDRPGTASYASETSNMHLALAQDCAEFHKQAQAKATAHGFVWHTDL
jgi:hypothetical protein